MNSSRNDKMDPKIQQHVGFHLRQARKTAKLTLREAADKVESGNHPGNLRDINGNKVGEYAFTN